MKNPVVKSSTRATPYARPLTRRSVSDPPTPMTPTRSRRRTRPTLRPLDFRFVRKGATAEVAAIVSSGADPGFFTPPSLRRASTLTLNDDSSPNSTTSTSPHKSDSLMVDVGSLSTSLGRLSSGSMLGKARLSRPSSTRGISKHKLRSFRKSSSSVSSLLRHMTVPTRLSPCPSISMHLTCANSTDEDCLVKALRRLKRIDVSTRSESGTENEVIHIEDIGRVALSTESSQTSLSRQLSAKSNRTDADKNTKSFSHGLSVEDIMDITVDSETTFSGENATVKPKGHKRSVSTCNTCEDSDNRSASNDGASDDSTMEQSDVSQVNTPSIDGVIEVAISFDTTGSV